MTSAKEETAHYKKLTETLKQKLRGLSDQSGDNQAFLDTFEEVKYCWYCVHIYIYIYVRTVVLYACTHTACKLHTR